MSKNNFEIIVFTMLLFTACGHSIKKRTVRIDNKNVSCIQVQPSDKTVEKENNQINSADTNDNYEKIKNTENKKFESKLWKKELLGGGYCEYVQKEDGTLISKRVEPCLYCHGTKICPACNGAGGVYGRAYGGMYYPCSMCLQSGQCRNCKGEGFITTVTQIDPNGNAVSLSSNGMTAVGNAGGTVVTDINGNRAYPTKGSISNGESRNGQTEYKNNEYFDYIDYNVPNYTGDDDSEWCERCREYKPRHRHVKKRIK